MTDARRPPTPLRLAVCVSGGGTTLQNLIDRIGRRPSPRRDRPGRRRAGRGSARSRGPRRRGCRWRSSSGAGRTLDEFSAGGLRADPRARGRTRRARRVPLAARHPRRLPRPRHQHPPSLIPAFCGKGYHGAAVHQAAIDSGVKVSGCTVHFADATYDTGPIILQRPVPVLDDDDARVPRRPRLRGRVRGPPRGDHALRRGPPRCLRPSRPHPPTRRALTRRMAGGRFLKIRLDTRVRTWIKSDLAIAKRVVGA